VSVEPSEHRSDWKMWLVPLGLLGYAVVFGLVGWLLISLFPSRALPIGMGLMAVFVAVPGFTAGLHWHDPEWTVEAHTALKGLAMVFLLAGAGDGVWNAIKKTVAHGPGVLRELEASAFLAASLLLPFAIGKQISRRRHLPGGAADAEQAP